MRAQIGWGKYILGILLMLGISLAGGFYLFKDLNLLVSFILSDPIFAGISIISGFLFGFIARRSISGPTGSSSMFFLAIILSAGLIIGYGFLNGDLMLGITKILENTMLFLVFYVGGLIGGLVIGSYT